MASDLEKTWTFCKSFDTTKLTIVVTHKNHEAVCVALKQWDACMVAFEATADSNDEFLAIVLYMWCHWKCCMDWSAYGEFLKEAVSSAVCVNGSLPFIARQEHVVTPLVSELARLTTQNLMRVTGTYEHTGAMSIPLSDIRLRNPEHWHAMKAGLVLEGLSEYLDSASTAFESAMRCRDIEQLFRCEMCMDEHERLPVGALGTYRMAQLVKRKVQESSPLVVLAGVMACVNRLFVTDAEYNQLVTLMLAKVRPATLDSPSVTIEPRDSELCAYVDCILEETEGLSKYTLVDVLGKARLIRLIRLGGKLATVILDSEDDGSCDESGDADSDTS